MNYKIKKTYVFLFLIIVNIFLYSGGISNNFINLDDSIYVVNNIKVHTINLKNLKWAFTTIYFGNYSPFLWISYMIDYYIGNGEAIVFHIHNLIIHIINTYLIFLCTNIILKNSVRAFFASLLFSLLALNIEPVLWISSRKDLLCGLYFFLSMFLYLLYKEEKKNSYLALSFFSILIGSLIKSSVSFFVLVMFLIDYLYFSHNDNNNDNNIDNNNDNNKKINKKELCKKIPFVFLFFIIVYIGLISQKIWGAVYNYTDLGFYKRIFNASKYIIDYIRRVFYPSDLSIMYNHPYDSISIRAGLFFIFCIASFLLLVFIYRKKNKLLLFSSLFFLFTIAPYLQLSQIGIQAIADRWCYIAKYGVVLFLFSFSFKSILKKRLHIIIIFLVALVNLYYGLPYASAWKNDISLYEYTLENNYKNNMVYRLLAKSYNHQATKEKNIRKYKEKYLNNLIMSLNENILDIESFHMFLRAIKKNSATHKAKLKEFIDRLFKVSNDSVDNKKYKSIILADLEGNSFAKNYITKNYGVHPLEMANGLLSEAMAKDSKNLELYISYLKVAHYAKIKKAVIKTILKLFPNSQQALFFAGSDAYNTKNFDEAITKLKKYVEIAPNSAESYGMIASSYIEKNDYNNALTYAKYALQSSENHPNMKAIYYDILLKKGKKDKVILEILNDISLNNYNTNTLKILAKIYEEKGLYKKALKLYKLSLKDEKTIESYENIANIYKTLNCKALYNKYSKIACRMKSKIKNQPKESISINVILGMPMN